jgi:hypothetical protein
VGISLNAINRLSQHSETSSWFPLIARVEIQTFVSREIALEEERKAVQSEDPKHNINLRKSRRYEAPQAEEARSEVLRRVTQFNPLYRLEHASSALGIGVGVLRREIKAKRLGCVQVPNNVGTMTPHITGWQLIDYLEAIQGESDDEGEKQHDSNP